MSEGESSQPAPPDGLPERVARTLRPRSPEQLRDIASWAESVIEWHQNMPTLPEDLPDYTTGQLQVDPAARPSRLPERLRKVADYARDLAAWKHSQDASTSRDAREEVTAEEKQELQSRDDVDLQEFDVPKGAYLVKKEIDGRQYWYYQWREGPNKWGNKYVAPVEPA